MHIVLTLEHSRTIMLSAEYCKQFTGLSWISFFIKFVKEKGHNVLTGDIV